jgi:hypothetical protein
MRAFFLIHGCINIGVQEHDTDISDPSVISNLLFPSDKIKATRGQPF